MTISSAGFTARALATLFLTGTLAVLGVSLPVAAGAYATIAPPPSPSASSGLPDGRVYEQVSPSNKYGNNAGAQPRYESSVGGYFAIASADGDAVAYQAHGPVGETVASGLGEYYVAERTSKGWKSRSSTARALRQNEKSVLLAQYPYWPDFSPDLSHMAYAVRSADVAGAPEAGYANLYLLGTEPFAEPIWLLHSVAGPSLAEHEGTLAEHKGTIGILGMTPDASVVYFATTIPLLPQDAARSGFGLYASRDGVVSEVGVLPDGSVPETGAVPAGTADAEEVFDDNSEPYNPASADDQLSLNGRRLFFVAGGQLYVHELEADGSERSVLVSGSQLPGHIGEAAPAGVAPFENLVNAHQNKDENTVQGSTATYAYASPDGSHVLFQSTDQLTGQAPTGGALKVYDFDVDTGSLEYLPGVHFGGVVTAASDGSSFAFVNDAGSSPELDLWTAGAGGGSVRQIVQLPAGGFVGPGRTVAAGSVIVFQAQGPIPGVNGSEDEQIYRYDVKSNELSCVSCPAGATARSGDAYLSALDTYGHDPVNDVRGVSSDGTRIFFATPNALVSRDTNGDFDTYEWENGTIFLISSGTSTEYSLFLDSSESGGDVFFATTDELVQGDSDGSFDIYDARIPRPGDNPPPSAVPCAGDVCQGPPSVPQLLGAPPSATFNGAGNGVEEQHVVKAKSKPKASPKVRKLSSALGACRKRKSKSKRAACKRRARKLYAVAQAPAKHNGGRGK